jgi:hypothetical protein
MAACEADQELVDASIPGGAVDGSYNGSLDGGRDALVDLAEGAYGDGAAADGGSGDARNEPHPEPGRLAGITAAHNAARAAVSTTPSLPPLSWSPAVAAVAAAYASKLAAACEPGLSHSSPEERMNFGENLVAFSDATRGTTQSPGSASETVALWYSERACYSYGPFQSGVNERCTQDCGKYGGCGHYTQLAWRKSERLGCAVAECTRAQTRRSYWVCHYDPAGNISGDLPY